MSDLQEEAIADASMAGVEGAETTDSSMQASPTTILADSPKAAAPDIKAPLKEEERPVLHLKLPWKVYAAHVAQQKDEKPKRSPAANQSRPSQVPPLVFPHNNPYEERTGMSLSSNNSGAFVGAGAATENALQASSNTQQGHSPLYWDPSDSASRNGPVSCMMFHKIRGGKGEWREVAPWELIRVTKGVGKKVKMVVEAPGRFGPGDVHISLTDMTDQVRTPRTPGNRSSKSSRFIVESTTVGAVDPDTGKSSAELIIKLFKLSKQLIFQATVSVHGVNADGLPSASSGSSILRGQSMPFGTHNSGKQRRKREKDGDEDDDDDVPAHHGAAGHHHHHHGSAHHNANASAASNAGGHHAASTNAAAGSGAAASGSTSLYPRRRKQPKRHENDDNTWVSLPPIAVSGGGKSGAGHGGHHHHSTGAAGHAMHNGGVGAHGTMMAGEELLEQLWPPEDVPLSQHKEMIAQVNNVMRDFGNKYLLDEARKRRAGIVVYVACRPASHQTEDFTTFVYKHENLLKEDAVTMGSPLGRALFIPDDERGESMGVFTLVAAVRLAMGMPDVMFAPNSGIAAIYDFRRDGDHLMKTIPIHSVLLAQEPTTVWLIGSFQVDARTIAWLSPPQPQPQTPAAAMMGLPGAGFAYAPQQAAAHPHQFAYGAQQGFRPGMAIGPFGVGVGMAASIGVGNSSSSISSSSAGQNSSTTAGTAGSSTAGNAPLIPPLPLGTAALGYPHLTVQYSPRGTLHSPSPYYGNASATAAGYLAPKPLYPQSSPAPSPSSTPIPGATGSSGATGSLGPPTPGLGQTPRGFGDMLSPFGSNAAGMMGSGFYSPLSNASYSQPLYMFDPLLLSARGLGPDHASGFYSPTSSATSAGSAPNLNNGNNTSGSSTASSNQYKGVNAQQQQQAQLLNQQYAAAAYNMFPGGFQGSISGFPGNSPRFEELLDSGRM